MAYTFTIVPDPSLKVPSGTLSISFYSTASGTDISSANSYVLSIGEIIQEFEIQNNEMLLDNLEVEVWDKDGRFRYNILQDLQDGNIVKATILLNGSTLFVGVIDENSVSVEQKYLDISNDEVLYAINSNSISMPIEIIKFTIKDILSLLEEVSIKSLLDRLNYLKTDDAYWELSNGVIEVIGESSSDNYTHYFISVHQLLREIFSLLPSDLIKIGIQIQDNILSTMSKDYFDYNKAFHLRGVGAGGTLDNTIINKQTGLKNLYLLFYKEKNTDATINYYSSMFKYSPTDESIPSSSFFNLKNCYELFNKICYTFDLVPKRDYTKKSIHSIDITNVGYGYVNNVSLACPVSGGNGGGALIYIRNIGTTPTTLGVPFITDNGANYTSTPDLIVPPPYYGTEQATASLSVSSSTTAVTVNPTPTFGGSGYSALALPTVTIDPPPTKRTATIIAHILYSSEDGYYYVSGLEIIDGGSGYVAGDILSYSITIEKSKKGADATAHITSIANGRIDGVYLDNGGTWYPANTPPSVTVTQPPDTIQATAEILEEDIDENTGEITLISQSQVNAGGRGYDALNPPTITIDPPDVVGQGSADIILSDFDIYFKRRKGINQDTNINTNILESSIETNLDGYTDAYEVSTFGYTNHDYDTTNLVIKEFPKSKHSGETCFGLLHWNGTDYSSHTDNYLISEVQFKQDATTNSITSNQYMIPRFIHNNINLLLNTRLINSNNWTTANATFNGSDGVSYGGGEEVYNTGYFQMGVQTNSDINNPTKYIVGNLIKVIYGEPLVFSAWVKRTESSCDIDKIYVQALDEENNIVPTKNISTKDYIDVDVSPKTIPTSSWVMVAFALEPLDLQIGIAKIRIFFTYVTGDGSGTTKISYPQLFVGAETLSRWLVNRYYNYFSRQTYLLNRKYDGLIDSNINIGDYITDNGQFYYIKRISKNLVDNETEIEAINYLDL